MSRSYEIPEAVARLLADQSGLATQGQLRAHGMARAGTSQTAGTRVATRPTPVVVAGRPALTEHQRLVAALLFAGEGALLSGLTAASWHGVRAAGVDKRVHVTIPAHRTAAARLRPRPAVVATPIPAA